MNVNLELLPQFALFLAAIVSAWWTLYFVTYVGHWINRRFFPKWLVRRLHVNWINYLVFVQVVSGIILCASEFYFIGFGKIAIAVLIYIDTCHYCSKDDDDDGLWEKVKDWVTIKPVAQRQPVRT